MRTPWFTYYFSHDVSIESQYLYQKAMECADEGRNEDAVRYFQQAVIMSPRFSRAFFEMGHCYARLGNPDRAAEVYRRAAKIDPLMNDDAAKMLAGIGRQGDADPAADSC